jgi:hypothetical protein
VQDFRSHFSLLAVAFDWGVYISLRLGATLKYETESSFAVLLSLDWFLLMETRLNRSGIVSPSLRYYCVTNILPRNKPQKQKTRNTSTQP